MVISSAIEWLCTLGENFETLFILCLLIIQFTGGNCNFYLFLLCRHLTVLLAMSLYLKVLGKKTRSQGRTVSYPVESIYFLGNVYSCSFVKVASAFSLPLCPSALACLICTVTVSQLEDHCKIPFLRCSMYCVHHRLLRVYKRCYI